MPTSQGLSIATHLALMKAGRERAELVVVPPPPVEPKPFEVRLRASVGDTVLLIGHDRRGQPFSEWRVPRRKVTARMVSRFGKWCRENDDGPELRIL